MRVTLFLLLAFMAFAFSQKVMLYNYRETCNERTLEDNIEVYDNDHCVQSLSRHNYFKYACNRTHVTYGQYQDSSCQNAIRQLAFPINSCQVNSRYVCGAAPPIGQFGYAQRFYYSRTACDRSAIPMFSFIYHGGCVSPSIGESTRRYFDNLKGDVVHEQYPQPNCQGQPSTQRFAIDQCKEHLPPFNFKYEKARY